MNVSWLNTFIGSVINTTVTTCGTAATNIYTAYQQQRSLLIGNSSGLGVLQATLAALHPKTVYVRLLDKSTEALEHLAYAFLAYFLVCLAIYTIIFRYKGLGQLRLPWPTSHAAKRVLFVTSHPDDECMFFGPLIYSLTRQKQCEVYLLCLSNGNYEKQSSRRREELWHACTHLGLPQGNIILVNATNLPDDPNVDWKTDAVASIILHTVETLSIQALFTFDRDGVSQHPNHCAVYYAAASLCLANLLPKDCKFYTLDSINILRKYLSIFDIICTCFMSRYWCILSWQESSVVRNAMKKHQSQMKWFRWLYIFFSRYMFINSIREVNLTDVELEMQIHDN
ncbi:N-acetylglucosaminyl-phosphatidylinositol de-N-acetylase [Musca domestica]|uniref:N-acetylglucosaminyl-phosphatidylinositol de-N-acetylase n=1 Tax=Musca domestica TaxID=7370 RepID=A0A1I8NHB3_MUSDO|nr:N-acetylglucosaminyl-phosphatidylinositol de-N-acetylase [Musca domestica]